MKEFSRTHIYSGKFNPIVTSDLQHGSEDLIGKTLLLEYDGIREIGEYEGSHSFRIYDREKYYGWSPLCDFKDLRETTAFIWDLKRGSE